jgi:membrane protease YdiL (CAAX protease family)
VPASLTSSRDDRWRQVSRVGLFWIGYLTVLMLLSVSKSMVPARWGQLVWGAMSALALVMLTRTMVRWEGRNARDIGLVLERATARRFLSGALLGFAVFASSVAAIALFTGALRLVPTGGPDGGAALLTLSTLLALAAMEELGFRGYTLRVLGPVLGGWRAQAVVAIAFALSHVAFGWPWQSIALGVLPSAVLFGACAVASGGLAMPIGVHMAVNVARWAVGETDGVGFWTVAVDASAQTSVAATAQLVSPVVTLIAAGAVWTWQAHSARKSGEPSLAAT